MVIGDDQFMLSRGPKGKSQQRSIENRKTRKMENEKADAEEQLPVEPPPPTPPLLVTSPITLPPPSTMTLTLDQLNDDCLECIFTRVHGLRAQLQMSRVCRRFRELYVERVWRRNRTYHTLALDDWREWLPQHSDLAYFLKATVDTIQAVDILDECLNVFLQDCDELGLKQLPRVTHCDLSAFGDCYPSDDDIRSLSQLLPNLRWLRCTAPISGRHIASVWPQLEELLLYDGRDKVFEIRSDFLQQICVKLRQLRVLDIRDYEMSQLQLMPAALAQCDQLRELRLNLNALKPVLRHVLALPRLERLVVLLDNVIDVSRIDNVDTHDYKIYETTEFFEILRTCASRISGLAVDNYFLPLPAGWDEGAEFLRNDGGVGLRQFAFCNSDFAPHVLEKYARGSPQLQLLCLRNWDTLTNAAVLQFVERCPQLQHLDVSYCRHLDKTLLYKILELRQQQHECSGRRPPLNIYHINSGLDPEVWHKKKFWEAQQQFVKFSADLPPNSELGLSYVARGFAFEFA